MAVPKYRISASRRDKRRSHHALKCPVPSYCPSCGEVKRAHKVCTSCGKYKDLEIVQVKRGNANLEDFNPNEA